MSLGRELLRRLTDTALADSILGDLEEGRRLRARHSVLFATCWVWWAFAGIFAHALLRRLGDTASNPGALIRAVVPSVSEARTMCRSLLRSPWYAATVVGVTALMLSLSTVVFAVVDGVLFKPLPYQHSGELHVVTGGFLKGQHSGISVSAPDVERWSAASPDSQFSLFQPWSGGGQFAWTPIPVAGDRAFLSVLGVRPLVGGFDEQDFTGQTDARPTLITYEVWQSVLGGSPDVLGKTLPGSSRTQYRVAGVLPQGFVFPTKSTPAPNVLVPLVLTEAQRTNLHMRVFSAIARLAPDVGFGVHQARLDAAAATVAGQWVHRPGEARGAFDHVALEPLDTALAGSQRTTLLVIFGAAASLILLGCLNVSGLMTSRTRDREREFGVRRALGAGAVRIARLLLIEAGCLVAVGGAVGALASRPLLTATLRLLPDSLVLLKAPALDWRVAAFVGCAVLFSTALISVWPVLDANRRTVIRAPAAGIRLFMAAQVATCLVLTLGGVLLVGSLLHVWRQDPGFATDNTLVIEARLGADQAALRTARMALMAKVGQIPGVERTASFDGPLLTSSFRADVSWQPPPGGRPQCLWGPKSGVSTGFFDVLGVRAIKGRVLTDDEIASGQPLAVVSQRTAADCFPAADPIGRVLIMDDRAFTVAGVVPDVRFGALDAEDQGGVYVSNAAFPANSRIVVAARLSARGNDVMASVIRMLQSSEVASSITRVAMVDDALADSVRMRRLQAWLFGLFGISALTIVAVGIAGLLAMTTARRAKEIGIRLALGATRTRIIGLLVWEHLTAVVAGIVVGVVVSAWAVRFVQSYLYEVGAYDLRMWAMTIGTILATAAGGILIPCVRGTRINPAVTLRSE